jgi:hypothetical protein
VVREPRSSVDHPVVDVATALVELCDGGSFGCGQLRASGGEREQVLFQVALVEQAGIDGHEHIDRVTNSRSGHDILQSP